MQKWLKRFFSKNAAQLEVFYNIGQYLLIFGEKVVSNLGKSGQYNGQYTDFFLQTTVVITGYETFVSLFFDFIFYIENVRFSSKE